MQLKLSDIEQAWALKDPAVVDYIIALVEQQEPEPDEPIRDEALSFERFMRYIMSWDFQQKSKEEQKAYRIEKMALLESDDAEVPLPERLKLHQILFSLAQDDDYYARTVLIDIIRKVPLRYGLWRALKRLFKQAEAQNDFQLLGEISARLDSTRDYEFSAATMLYMRRRAWRYLRKLGESLPACYPEAALYCLAAYDDNTRWANTWVANHIFYHQSKIYSHCSFSYNSNSHDLLKNRAFAETWKRSPEILLRLLGLARSEHVRHYACKALQHDFPVVLRSVDAQWIINLTALPVKSSAIDGFVVWLLENAPKLEQQQFRSLGLHQAVVSLLTSDNKKAQNYAINYVKAHARDLSLDELLHLASYQSKPLIKLVQQLLSERDPRKQVGLEAWGKLLDFPAYASFSSKVLIKHFGRKELTANWFQQRLLRGGTGFQFAREYLLELHPLKSLGVAYFQALLENINFDDYQMYAVKEFVIDNLSQLDLTQLPLEFVQRALLHPHLSDQILQWLEIDKIKTSSIPLDFYQALVFEPDWKQHPFILQLQQSDLAWAKEISYSDDTAEQIREWLSDVRRFSPSDLGFEWLMKLVNREESVYHDFAVELMIKAFVPADFAPQSESQTSEKTDEKADTEIDKTIDLAQQSYLFTGKLKTMTRKQAQLIVSEANGKNSNAVNGKLDYLVIGDEGSPMYGNGRKGSKQIKAEALIEKGASLKIISETAFLQMMAGEQREFSDDRIIEGCNTLWAMATDKVDTPISKFAIKYIREHHPDICLKLTDRPVDPGAEIPKSFATFNQFKPLFDHSHTELRKLALDYAHYEFAEWSPPSADLIRLCESKYVEIREFTSEALLAEPEASNKRYRLDTESLDAAAVYSFCESKQAETRQLGMQIIQQYAKFQLPEALYQLTESPDRELRYFVVRMLWSLYRRYATTKNWQPHLPVMPNMSKAEKAKQQQIKDNLGTGLPKQPENRPADNDSLQQLLQRWLYELPPGRLASERLQTGLKPLSASKAKQALIETFRDLALEDIEFAQMVLPLLNTFTQSRGAMEQAACLVAVTRINHAHPSLLGGA